MKRPVYLFTGFLDAGKTSFLFKTINSVDTEMRQVLLVCEDGDEQYENLPDNQL